MFDFAAKFQLFLQSSDVWSGAIAAGAIAGAVCGFFGVYIVLGRMVFVSAAMAQVSSLGVMLAFWLTSHAEAQGHHAEDTLAVLLAIAFTLGFASFLVRHRLDSQHERARSSESAIGVAYILASAFVILVADRVSQGAHDVSNLLFGNAVIVDEVHLRLLAIASIPLLAIHVWLFKDVFFVSFDPATATTMRYPVRRLQLLLLLSIGIVISVATRTIGALPVFSFSVLPAILALACFQNIRVVFLVAAVLGALSAVGGYAASFMFSLPTGASMTAFAGAALIVGLGAQTVLRLLKPVVRH